jgi:AcrR family transcriptional regulator
MTEAPSKTRVRLEADARRTQLIELGLTMLSGQPLERVAIDDIAEAAGVSRGLLFHYFPSKRHFHVAVVQAAADRLLALTEPEPDGDDGAAVDGTARLRTALAVFVDYVTDNEALYVSLVRGAAGGDPDFQSIFEDTRSRIAARIIDALGLPAPAPALRTAVRGWVGFVEEATLDWLRHRDIDRGTLIGLAEQTLIAAVLAAGVTVPG